MSQDVQALHQVGLVCLHSSLTGGLLKMLKDISEKSYHCSLRSGLCWWLGASFLSMSFLAFFFCFQEASKSLATHPQATAEAIRKSSLLCCLPRHVGFWTGVVNFCHLDFELRCQSRGPRCSTIVEPFAGWIPGVFGIFWDTSIYGFSRFLLKISSASWWPVGFP